MAAWKRILIIYLSTAIIGSFTYVTAVVIFEGGIELGEPMWKGYLLQLATLSVLGFIYLGIFYLPIMLIVEKIVKSSHKKLAFYSASTVLFLTFAYIQYSGAGLLSSLPLSIFASMLLFIVQYLTMHPSSCFARDRANPRSGQRSVP